jgi:hypothetical protein
MIKRDPLSGAHIRRILREIADKQLGTEYGTPVALMLFRGELALGLIGCSRMGGWRRAELGPPRLQDREKRDLGLDAPRRGRPASRRAP